jgi:hypothetical protein
MLATSIARMIYPANSGPVDEDNSTVTEFRNLWLAPQIFVIPRLRKAFMQQQYLKSNAHKRAAGYRLPLLPKPWVARG